MRAASRHNDSADQAAAIATRLTGALVNAMFELEESAYTFGVDVVGDGRAAEADSVFQNFPQRHAQSLQFSPGELSGSASWANAGAKIPLPEPTLRALVAALAANGALP